MPRRVEQGKGACAMSQISFADAEYVGKKKTGCDVLLEEMELVVPWKAVLKLDRARVGRLSCSRAARRNASRRRERRRARVRAKPRKILVERARRRCAHANQADFA